MGGHIIGQPDGLGTGKVPYKLQSKYYLLTTKIEPSRSKSYPLPQNPWGENKLGSSASSLLQWKDKKQKKTGACILRNLKTKGKSFLCIDLEKTSNVKRENKKVNESVKLRKKCRILHLGEKVVLRI